MRLLPLSALLLLLVSTCLCAPLTTNEEPLPDGEVRTTVETVFETVTRTVIHEITDPATEAPVTTTPAPVPTEPAAPPKTTIETVLETVTRTVVHEVTDPSTTTTTAVAVVPEEVPVHGETGLVPAPGKCPACNCNCNILPATSCCAANNGCGTAAEVAADTTITEISGQVKQCSCADAEECRDNAKEGLESCMEECDEHIKVYGEDKDKIEKNRKCFAKGEAIITEAENCLFDKKTDEYCNNSTKETKFIEHPKWDELSEIKYTSEAHKDIKDNYLWKQHEGKYTNFQKFFHCTKHCLHKKFRECTSDKGCTVKMPTKVEFAEKMKTCTKKNVKISTAILTTCQCLAWTNGVKDLQGSCVTIGNSYFVDRA